MNNDQAHAETAEVVEGRELAKGQAVEHNRVRTQCRGPRQRALDRIRQAARRDRATRLTALWHHVDDIDRLRETYDALKREAAPGIAGCDPTGSVEPVHARGLPYPPVEL